MCIVNCSIALLQEHECWKMINKYKTRIKFAPNRKIVESIKLFLKILLGFINGKRAAKYFFCL